MYENVQEILEYLPLAHKRQGDYDYFNFLIDSVQKNYDAENYHFSLVAIHMIYMGIVYHYIYGIYKADKKRFDYVLIGFHDMLKNDGEVSDFNDMSWQNFSVINESTIFQFYRAVGISNDQIGNLKNPVKTRNDYLHANGTYLSNEEDFEKQVQVYLKNLEKIHQFCFNEYRILFSKFLGEIKIEIQDEGEAGEYLNNDFVRENGANIIILRDLLKDSYTKGKNIELIINAIKKDY